VKHKLTEIIFGPQVPVQICIIFFSLLPGLCC